MSKHDGGPAFPATGTGIRRGCTETVPLTYDGMSLRDWFAGQALVGVSGVVAELLVMRGGEVSESGLAQRVGREARGLDVCASDLLLEICYDIADDMLQARAKPTEDA